MQRVNVYAFCLLFSDSVKVVALLIFMCCYQHVLVNKDIYSFRVPAVCRLFSCDVATSRGRFYLRTRLGCHSYIRLIESNVKVWFNVPLDTQ